MTEYAYSRNEPSISVATSMSTMRSATSSGGTSGVAGRRAIVGCSSGQDCCARPLWTELSPDGPRRAGHRTSLTDMADVTGDAPTYPAGWEAHVVLHDGSTTRVRPILPSDADALQAFHMGQSERSIYLRFFAAMERLSERDLQRLVTVDHVDRVALVAVADVGGSEHIIGVARYDRLDDDDAEVAFNVADAHQGRGLGSVLLEHLAAAARERGVRRFVAEVLPQNGRMIAVFREAGYVVRQRTEDGIVALSFDIDPTDRSLAVMADREHRAEARSMRDLLHSSSLVVVGPGDDRGGTPAGLLAQSVL